MELTEDGIIVHSKSPTCRHIFRVDRDCDCDSDSVGNVDW